MRPSWTLVSSVFSLRMVGDWPGVTPPHNGFTRPRWARETDRERDGKRVEGCQKERNWTRKREERSQRSQREREGGKKRESRSLSEAGRARGWKTGRGEREEGNGSHIDFPMFPRIVTIAPGEGARRRQVPPSSTIPRASHPSTTNLPPSLPHPAQPTTLCVPFFQPMVVRWERETMDDGRAFPSGFLSLVFFFLPCSSLLHAPPSVFCFLSCCSFSPLFTYSSGISFRRDREYQFRGRRDSS